MREVINGIQHVLCAGGAWGVMPQDVPHWQMAYQYFRAWRRDVTWRRLHDQVCKRVRTQMGCHPQSSAAIIDAPTVKTTENAARMGMMAPKNPTTASTISSWIRWVSCGVPSSIPPI
jgi:putative transposase